MCTLDECDRPLYAKGYCKLHYDRCRRTGNPLVKSTRVKQSDIICSVEDCDNPAYTCRLCNGHYQRQRQGIESDRPIGRAWREYPYEYTNKRGYTVVVLGREYSQQVLKHRMVMEQTLGRELLSTESVHHINGDKTDNRPENLELWSVSQPYGQRVSDKIRWAKEILELYGNDEKVYEV